MVLLKYLRQMKYEKTYYLGEVIWLFSGICDKRNMEKYIIKAK